MRPRRDFARRLGGDAGLRQGAIRGLEWEDIDFDEKTITVRRNVWRDQIGTPKGGRPRVIPMTTRLFEALQAIPHERGLRVFCSAEGTPLAEGKMQMLWRLCKKSEVREISWHTLRHTYCSHLGMLGAAPVAIQLAAGHQLVAGAQGNRTLQAPREGRLRRL